MCGFAGKLNFNPKKPVSSQLIEKMTETLSHRGPDDKGFYVKNNVGLGHRRLKIIDLSQTARQPLSNEDKSLWIVFNGEIYNFKELRKDLIKKGHKFSSRSDTETIIHLYEDWKENCLTFLRGMFAFAIWDEKEQKLFLARDRLGKKPLKYYLGRDFFIFSSEAKALFKDPEVKKEIDYQAISDYLTFQYVPSPNTGFKNIKKLPPAHYLVCQNREVSIKRYWKLDFSQKLELPEKEWKRKILEKLEESVSLRLTSDVPLGAFLSGGIDSSTIVALMSRFSLKPVETFSVGFREIKFNELPYARKIAEKFKTLHHEIIVQPEAINILPKLAYYYEEPFADSSAIPSFYLAEFAKKYVTVALSGDGGDENFAGYNRHSALKVFLFFQKFPKISLPFVKTFLCFASRLLFHKTSQDKLVKFFQKLGDSPEKAYLQIISYFNEAEKTNILNENFRREIKNPDSPFNIVNEKFMENPSLSFLEKVFYVDLNLSLPEDLLVKMDIASMANSLEIRSPFLDHQLLELTAKIPASLKLKGLTKKYIFKKVLKDILPKEIILRKKMGFGVSIEDWFKKELKKYTYETLLGKQFLSRGLFRKEAVKKILDEHSQGKKNWAFQIWALLFLENWLQVYFD